MNKIEFYYWGNQCPHNEKMIKRFEKILDTGEAIIKSFDISKNHEVARNLNIFSPNMTVINDNIRWHGPISEETLREILKGNIPEGKPYRAHMSKDIIKGEIRDLTEDTVIDTCTLCASSNEKKQCSYKAKWIKDLRKEFNLPCLGKLHYLNEECIGGAEFVPSNIVPYPIPKAKDLAFLTCVFGTSEEGDYKTYPLEELEKELVKLGYNSIVAIASEDTPFPNGPLGWFLDRGYKDIGFIFYEERHFAKMHLVEKRL